MVLPHLALPSNSTWSMLTPLKGRRACDWGTRRRKRVSATGLERYRSKKTSSRINNVGVDALATLRVVIVAVEGAESERLAVRDPSESLRAIRRVSEQLRITRILPETLDVPKERRARSRRPKRASPSRRTLRPSWRGCGRGWPS